MQDQFKGGSCSPLHVTAPSALTAVTASGTRVNQRTTGRRRGTGWAAGPHVKPQYARQVATGNVRKGRAVPTGKLAQVVQDVVQEGGVNQGGRNRGRGRVVAGVR